MSLKSGWKFYDVATRLRKGKEECGR